MQPQNHFPVNIRQAFPYGKADIPDPAAPDTFRSPAGNNVPTDSFPLRQSHLFVSRTEDECYWGKCRETCFFRKKK